MLNRLKGKALKCNNQKLFFGQTRTEYLGFWVTGDGIKPINKNIEAINNTKPPNS